MNVFYYANQNHNSNKIKMYHLYPQIKIISITYFKTNIKSYKKQVRNLLIYKAFILP